MHFVWTLREEANVKIKSSCRAMLLWAALAWVPGNAASQEGGGPPKISVTEAQLMTTFNEDQGSPYLVGTLQHFSTWRFGSNFFFADVSSGPDLELFNEQLGIYLEYAPVFSLSQLGILPLAPGGALRDVGVTAQINGGWTANGFPIDRVFLEGVELAWSVPGFAVFNTQLLARQEEGYRGSWQGTWVYTLPFAVGGASGEVTGFLDVWRRSRAGEAASTVLLAQPQLLVNVGSPDPGESRLQLGVELEPSHDFPARAVRPGWNFAVSPMVRWIF